MGAKDKFLKIQGVVLSSVALAGVVLPLGGCPSPAYYPPSIAAPLPITEVSWAQFKSDTSGFAAAPAYADTLVRITGTATASDAWNFANNSAAALSLVRNVDTSGLTVTFSSAASEILTPAFVEGFFRFANRLGVEPKDLDNSVLIQTGAAGATTRGFDIYQLSSKLGSGELSLSPEAIMSIPAGMEVVLDVVNAVQKQSPVPAAKLEYLLSHGMFAGTSAKVADISIGGNIRKLANEHNILTRTTATPFTFDGATASYDAPDGSPEAMDIIRLDSLMSVTSGGRGLSLSNVTVEDLVSPPYAPLFTRFGRKYRNVELESLNIPGVSFANAEFDNVAIDGSNVGNSSFRKSKGTIEFKGAALMIGADMSEAELSGRIGAMANADSLKAAGAKLHMKFETATVANIDLSGATLKAGSTFPGGTDLTLANFTGLRLEGMLELSHCKLPVRMSGINALDPVGSSKSGLSLSHCEVGSNGVNATNLGGLKAKYLEISGGLAGYAYLEFNPGQGKLVNYTGPGAVYAILRSRLGSATGDIIITIAALNSGDVQSMPGELPPAVLAILSDRRRHGIG